MVPGTRRGAQWQAAPHLASGYRHSPRWPQHRPRAAACHSPAPLTLWPDCAPCHQEYRWLKGSSSLLPKSRSIRRSPLVRKDMVPTLEGKVTGTHLASWPRSLTIRTPSEGRVLGFPHSLWHVSGFHRRTAALPTGAPGTNSHRPSPSCSPQSSLPLWPNFHHSPYPIRPPPFCQTGPRMQLLLPPAPHPTLQVSPGTRNLISVQVPALHVPRRQAGMLVV